MVKNPHDALFKRTFGHPEHAAGELRTVLPAALCAALDLSTLRLAPGSFVDDELSDSHSDLLYEVSLAGRPCLIYWLFEHQSSVDHWMVFRLLRYMVRIWTRWLDEHPGAERLPVILPLVLYHGASAWSAPTGFEDLVDLDGPGASALHHVPRFSILVDDLSAHTDRALRDRAMTVMARLAVLLFKHGRSSPDLSDRLVSWAEAFRELMSMPNGLRAVLVLLRYALQVNDHVTIPALEAGLVAAVGSEMKEAVMTVAQQLIEEGRQEGLQEGRQEGLQEGQEEGRRRLLLRLLALKFGALPAAIGARVEGADCDTLDRWGERILTASTLDEVFAP